jgi:uncharacterized membrane protein YdfJ with MMPL/SSD domain
MRTKPALAARMGRWSASNPWKAVCGWLLLAIALTVLGGAAGTAQLSSTQLADGESKQALQMLHRAGLDLPAHEAVLVQSAGETVGSPAFTAALKDVEATLHATGRVSGTDTVSAQDATAGPVSADRRSTLVQFTLKGDSATAKDRVQPVLDAITKVGGRHPALTVAEFGEASFAHQAEDKLNKDYTNAEVITFVVSFCILLIVFGALVAALLPVLLAVTALVASIGLLALTSHAMPVDVNATSVMALVGIAVGVDYSLFYVRRFRAELAAGKQTQAAVEAAAATSGRSVIVSGLAVLVAVAGLFLAGDAEELATAEATMTVVVAALAGSVTLLPAMLSLLGKRIDKGRAPRRMRGVLSRRADRAWAAALGGVLRRPVAAMVIAGAAMVALVIPAFSLHTANSGVDDESANGIPVLRTYERIQQVFPDNQTTATVVVSGRGTGGGQGGQGSQADAIAAFVREVPHHPELHGPVTVQSAKDGRTAALSLALEGNGTDEQSVHALSVLRGSVIPRTLSRAPDTAVAVAGTTASSVDYGHRLADRTPYVAGFVLLLTLIIMLVAFRSPVIAAMTLVLNLLSVGAAYGVIVMIFQYGWGESLLGFHSVGGITSWVPLFLFVILFGLSMDYHVYVISAIREARDRGASTAEAVEQGILRSAGVITAAALVMIAVAFVFGLLPQLPMKETGIGLATAVLLDATLIRVVLLPVTMKLLGERNWYLPRWLRWLPEPSHAQEPTTGAAPAAQQETLAAR